MEDLQAIIEMISEKLSAVTSSDIVVGEPVKFGAITVVPIAKVSISIGASGGKGNSFSDKLYAVN